MACGCKKKKKVVPVTTDEQAPVAMLLAMTPSTVVLARCLNCGRTLLRTSDGQYITQNGEFYSVTTEDVSRWRAQGWVIEVANDNISTA